MFFLVHLVQSYFDENGNEKFGFDENEYNFNRSKALQKFSIYKMHSREKLKNVLVRKPGRKSYCFSQFLAKISSSRISYYFQLLKLVVVEFPTIFSF